MVKVLIVDDHESVSDSLTLLLESTGDFTVVGKLTRANLATAYAERLNPDLVFMDVCTEEGASGLEETKLLRERFPEIKIIVMTGFDEITYASRAKEAGAHAFVLKSRSLEYFLEVANGVLRGETYYPGQRTIPKSVLSCANISVFAA